MLCSKCAHDNEMGQRYCVKCGDSLESSVGEVHAQVLSEAATRNGLEFERKGYVAVLILVSLFVVLIQLDANIPSYTLSKESVGVSLPQPIMPDAEKIAETNKSYLPPIDIAQHVPERRIDVRYPPLRSLIHNQLEIGDKVKAAKTAGLSALLSLQTENGSWRIETGREGRDDLQRPLLTGLMCLNLLYGGESSGALEKGLDYLRSIQTERGRIHDKRIGDVLGHAVGLWALMENAVANPKEGDLDRIKRGIKVLSEEPGKAESSLLTYATTFIVYWADYLTLDAIVLKRRIKAENDKLIAQKVKTLESKSLVGHFAWMANGILPGFADQGREFTTPSWNGIKKEADLLSFWYLSVAGPRLASVSYDRFCNRIGNLLARRQGKDGLWPAVKDPALSVAADPVLSSALCLAVLRSRLAYPLYMPDRSAAK